MNILELPEEERDDIREYLSAIRDNSTIKRRQNYVSSIIVLYGALERYVEEAVAEFADHLAKIYSEFKNLPKKLQKQHTELTVDYLASLKDGKVREPEELSDVVATLNDCLNGKTPFRLNARAFSLRSSNMKLGRIRDIMGNLDIRTGGRRLLSTPAYSRFLEVIPGVSVKDMQDSEVESTLDHVDDLVALRNDIAHGVANLESIEENDIVRERSEKLRAFVSALNEILTCELLKARMTMKQFVPITGDVQVFGDDVACFLWPYGRIAPGDFLVMEPAERKADLRHGAIESIQIEGVNQTEVFGGDDLMIGVRVPFKVKANGTFYVWQRS